MIANILVKNQERKREQIAKVIKNVALKRIARKIGNAKMEKMAAMG
jgi:hypothetical protein